MAEYFISGIGVFGSGLVGWPVASGVLTGKDEYVFAEQPKLVPELLPAGVRRRAGSYIRLAAVVADEAVKNSTSDPAQLASVFATAESDGKITDAICRAVCEAQPVVSPTLFHNSVTNAPAGYWCMAVNSMKPSTSIAGQAGTFSVGLIEACLQLESESNDTLLVCHDVTMPHPLNKLVNMISDFGVGLVLTCKQQETSIVSIELEVVSGSIKLDKVDNQQIDEIRRGNEAARCLPLLVQIAKNKTGKVTLPYNKEQNLQITVKPCN